MDLPTYQIICVADPAIDWAEVGAQEVHRYLHERRTDQGWLERLPRAKALGRAPTRFTLRALRRSEVSWVRRVHDEAAQRFRAFGIGCVAIADLTHDLTGRVERGPASPTGSVQIGQLGDVPMWTEGEVERLGVAEDYVEEVGAEVLRYAGRPFGVTHPLRLPHPSAQTLAVLLSQNAVMTALQSPQSSEPQGDTEPAETRSENGGRDTGAPATEEAIAPPSGDVTASSTRT